MAPEAEVLKRKRSRPSNWWAAASTSIAPDSPQHDQFAKEKRDGSSNTGAKRSIKEAPTAANRGKRRRYVSQQDNENTEGGDEAVTKPLRRGRSSNTQAELEAVAAAELAAELDVTNKRKRRRPARKDNEKHVLNPLDERDLNAEKDPIVGDEVFQKKRGRTTKAGLEDELTVNEGEGTKKPGRRGRPTNYVEEDELGSDPVEAAVVVKKRGRPRSVSRGQEQIAAPSHEDPPPQGPAIGKRGRGRPRSVSRTGEQNEAGDGLVHDSTDGKRRRGRPRSVSRAVEQPPETIHNNDASKPPRRGRSSNTREELQSVVAAATEHLPAAKKRGQGSKTTDELASAADAPPTKDDAPSKPVRRGRSSNTEAEVWAVAETTTEEALNKRRKVKVITGDAADVAVAAAVENRKRTRISDAKTAEVSASSSTQELSRGKRRKGEENAKTDEPAATDLMSEPLRGRRRGRVSNTVEVETATSSFGKARTGSKKVDRGPDPANVEGKKASSAAEASQPHRMKGRGSSHADVKRKRTVVEEHAPEVKRRRVDRESQEEAPSTTNAPTYQHLAPVVRKVSRQKIEATWEPLGPAGVERISQLVHDIQRPVVAHFNDEKRIEANTALHMISRRLVNKVSKGMPFPPPMRNSREDDFDFEKILDHNRGLEAQLTEVQDANKQLESSFAQEREYLELEEACLVGLDANAKSATTMRNDAGRKLHSLLQSDAITNEDFTSISLGLGDIPDSVLPFSHTGHEDLQDIAQDLAHHLDTIEGNLARIEDVSEAMRRSRAAVQATLFEHLESGAYDDIVLG